MKVSWLPVGIAISGVALALAGAAGTEVNEKAILDGSEHLASQVRALAPRLQREFCCNSSLTQKQRIEIANVLAQLEYYPAIPDIMERITERREDDEAENAYTEALSIYGEAALPEIVDMLEKNATQHLKDGGEIERNRALAELIIEARLKTVVLGILRGRFVGTMDRGRQLDLRSAIKFVSALKETDDVPSP